MVSSLLTRRAGAWLIVIVAVAAYYPRFAKPLSHGDYRAGLDLLVHGAGCLWRGEALQACEVMFTYPPAFAFLMLPLLALPAKIGLPVWYLITIGATVASSLICEALARSQFPGAWTERERMWLCVASLALSLKFVLAVLENQAFDVHVLLLILVGLWALTRQRTVLAGASLAFAAALKGSPLIFLPYLLVTGRFLASGVFVAVYLGLSLLPDLVFAPTNIAHGYFATWVREVALGPLYDDPARSKYMFWAGVNPNNHSLRGLAYRLLPDGLADPWFRPVVAAMTIPVIGAVGLIVLKTMRRGGLVAIDGAALLIAMILLSPMTSRSHFVALLLPYTLLCAALIRDPGMRVPLGAVLGASFIFATALTNDLVGQPFTDWAHGHAVLALGALILLVPLGMLAWRAPAPAPRS